MQTVGTGDPLAGTGSDPADRRLPSTGRRGQQPLCRLAAGGVCLEVGVGGQVATESVR